MDVTTPIAVDADALELEVADPVDPVPLEKSSLLVRRHVCTR